MTSSIKLTLLAMGVLFAGPSFAEIGSTDASGESKPVAQKKIKRAKRKASKKKPPSHAALDVQTFYESTTFEQLLEKREEMARNPASFAPSARIIGVRRELGLTRDEADASAQDFILNGGTSNGIDEGLTLKVARKIPILDPYKGNEQKEMNIEFATIKVIHAERDISVARLVKLEASEDRPGVGNRAVLVGDYVGKVD